MKSEQMYELAGLKPGQTPEFAIVAATYIDLDGKQRFSWRIADELGGAEVESVIDLLNQVAYSISEHSTAVPLDPFE